MRKLLIFIIGFGLWLVMATSIVAVDNMELLPTFGVNNNQIHEASARKREKISLKTRVRDVYKSRENVELVVFNRDEGAVEVKLKTPEGEEVAAVVNQSTIDGVTTIDVDSPAQFVPGKYKLEVRDVTGATISQDFLWGVLAINPNKAVYNPNEKANLSMAVLDEKGDMVCDANVKLIIKNEKLKIKDELNTDNGKIIVNPECKTHGTGVKPDYGASYQLGGEGEYVLELTAITKNGTYSISDKVEVKNKIDFDVERISATRIYPVNSYLMQINLKANKSFEGEVYEVVPITFDITSNGGLPFKVVTDGETKKIIWKVGLNQGSTIGLSYRYKAPEISPQFYLLGQLWMANTTDLVYSEGRQWQIAADALSVAQIRQEINIIDGAVTVGGTDAAFINIDTTKYNGATYYFEVVASQGAGTTLTVNLSTGNTQSVGIGITNGTSIVRVRKSFVPETGSFDYRLNVVTGSTFSIQAARVIVLQSATNITATETQVELGNLEVGQTVVGGVKQPVMQAIGVSATATTGTASPAWPTHQTDDVALLFVETIGESAAVLSTPNGFAAVSSSPKSVGTGTSGTTLSVFWARATSNSMAAPVIKASGDHIYSIIVTYRNVIATGNPWDVAVGSTKAAVSTTTTWDSVTTTVDHTLIVFAASRHNDSAAAAWGKISNSNLTGITERVDGGTTSGNGGGIKVSDAILFDAGVSGSSTSTVTSSINAVMTIALKGGDNPAYSTLNSPKYWHYDASLWGGTQTVSAEVSWKKTDTGTFTPRFQAIGASATATTGTASPAWPAHQAGDVALLFVETIGNTVVTLSTPNGFAAVDGSPQATGVGGTNTALTVFWARATSGSMSAPVIKGSGNHIYSVIVTYRNVIATGNPWDVAVGSTKATTSTTTTWDSVTTTVDDTLLVFAASRGNDSAAATWGTITNPNLMGLNERSDGGTTSGDGGGIKISDGIMQIAGVGGTSTATMTVSNQNAEMVIALKGKIEDTTKLTVTLQEDDGTFSNWADKIKILDAGTSSGVPVHTRSASFTPTDGRNYRIVKMLNNSDGHSYDIYNAKIIIGQSGTVSKLETQYLLLNTKSTTTGSALGYQQLWNSGEWARTTNVYKHAQDAIGAGANSKLRDITASSDVTNSSITGENQTIGSSMTMPTSGDEFDTWLVNAGTEVDASRVLVQVTINAYGVDPTGYSFQRKTWYDGARYWRSYNDTANSRIVFEYSTDGTTWTENTSARIAVNTSDYSIEADSSNVFVVYTSSNDIKGRAATSYPGTGFGWGTEQVVFNGSGATDDYSYPTITRDSSGYVWSAARYTGSGVYFLKAMKETTTTNDLPEDTNDTVDSLVNSGNTDSNVYGVILPITSQNMYVTMAIGNTIAGCKWVNGSSAWQSSGGSSCTDNVGTLNNGLVGYWKMEELGGSARIDSSGYGNNLTESVGVTLPRVVGKYGYGGDFESSNLNYLAITDQPEFGLTNFTMSAWINEESSNTYGLIMGYGDGADWSYNMTTFDFGSITANLDQDGFAGGGVSPTTGNVISVSTWTLVTITYDGTTVRMFKNGVEQTTGDFPLSSSITLNNSTGNFYLGYFPNQSGYFDGILDDVRLYNRALGSSEVSQLYSYVPQAASYDAIGTGVSGLTTTLSAVADTSGNVHIAYVGVGGSIIYQEYTSSWQTAVTLDSNANNLYPSITVNTTNSDVYAFWIRDSHVYYKKGVSTYASGNWDASPTDWKSTGSNVFLTTNYSGSDLVFGEWYDGSAIQWDKLGIGGTTVASPSLQQLLRHGMWFVNGSKQKFTF